MGDKALWEGRMQYAYGYPDMVKNPSAFKGAPKVRVTQAGVEYREQKSVWAFGTHGLFSISRSELRGVRHEQRPGALFSPPDQFVVLKMNRGDQEYEVYFKAAGMTKQKDAFGLVNAVQQLLSLQP